MPEIERNPDGTPVGYPCCDRKFPDPDPMFRFIDSDEGPPSFWDLPHDERSRRLRAYLISLASGEHPEMVWMFVLDYTPENIQGIHELIDVENRDDRRVIGLIERGAREKAARIVR